ncbi:hypothetical protein AGMMS49960_20450 [Betaproteobacteria bacterium]|nr:hypothetical protein AGMMS49960_20450 [Betaproteobacteria bacterium]
MEARNMRRNIYGVRWRDLTYETYAPDFYKTQDILCRAFCSGIINWTTLNLGIEKTERVGRGSWMFEQPKKSR